MAEVATKALPKIYAFINGGSPGWYEAVAITEDGEGLAGHLCSAHGYGPGDMGVTSTLKHDIYQAKYPDGFEMVWLEPGSNPDDLALIKQIDELARLRNEAQPQAAAHD